MMNAVRYSLAAGMAGCLFGFSISAPAADDEQDLVAKAGLPPLSYTNAPAKIPNYPAGKRWGTQAEPFDQMQLPLSAAEATVKKLMPIAQREGNVARGKELFTTTCAVCHTFNGEGAKIGPELTGAGAKPKADILIDIIDPNRSVEANYRTWNVTTKDGENYAGRLDSETATSVDILDTAGKKHTLQRKDIADMNASALSIMPAGFEQLPPEDLAAILEYLTTSAHAKVKK